MFDLIVWLFLIVVAVLFFGLAIAYLTKDDTADEHEGWWK